MTGAQVRVQALWCRRLGDLWAGGAQVRSHDSVSDVQRCETPITVAVAAWVAFTVTQMHQALGLQQIESDWPLRFRV